MTWSLKQTEETNTVLPEFRSKKIQQALLDVKQAYEKILPKSFPGDARQTIAFLIRLCFSHPDDYSEITPFENFDAIRRASWGRPARKLPGNLADPLSAFGATVAAVQTARKVLLSEMDFEMMPTEAILDDVKAMSGQPVDTATAVMAAQAGIVLPTPTGTVPRRRDA